MGLYVAMVRPVGLIASLAVPRTWNILILRLKAELNVLVFENQSPFVFVPSS